MTAAATQLAIQDGAFTRLLNVYPTGLFVRLLRNGNEFVGNGYTRQPILSADPAVNVSDTVSKTLSSVTFTALGGPIVYDALDIVDSVGNQLFEPRYPDTPTDSSGLVIIPDGGSQTIVTKFLTPAADVTTAAKVQNFFNTFKTQGQDMRTKVGDILFPSTITTGYRGGGSVRGKGVLGPLALTDALSGPTSRWIWSGPRTNSDTDPLLRYQGTDMKFEDMCFDGATRAQVDAGAAKGPCGFWVDPTFGTGLGVGKVRMNNVYFSWWKTAMRLGTAFNNPNCDESTYYDVCFNKCDIGVEMVGEQVLGHQFHHPRFHEVGVCFNMLTGGGDLKVYGGLVAHPCSFLKFPAGSALHFGQNNNGYFISSLKLDSQATGTLLVDQYPAENLGYGYYSNIIFDALHFPSPQIGGIEKTFWGGNTGDGVNGDGLAPAFKISGNTTLQLRSTLNLQRGMLTWNTSGAGRPRIIVENAVIFDRPGSAVTAVQQLCNLNQSRGTAWVTFRNCFRYDTLAPLADFSNTMTGLLP